MHTHTHTHTRNTMPNVFIDVYVKIYLAYKGKRTKHWRSSTKANIHKLIFNEAFQFDLTHKEIRHSSLEVCVMSHDRFAKDEELGTVLIGDAVQHETGQQHWRQIVSQPSARVSHWHTFATAARKSRASI